MMRCDEMAEAMFPHPCPSPNGGGVLHVASPSGRGRRTTVRRVRECRRRSPASAAGFSLLEVLAAFVILALVGTALFRVFSGALGNVAVSDEYSRATLYAESRLAAIAVEAPLREGVQQGTSDDGYYAWSAKTEPYTPPGITADMDSATATMAIRLWRLGVTVRWPGVAGSERSIALATLRVAPRELNP